jgi:hypothetical protein
MSPGPSPSSSLRVAELVRVDVGFSDSVGRLVVFVGRGEPLVGFGEVVVGFGLVVVGEGDSVTGGEETGQNVGVGVAPGAIPSTRMAATAVAWPP